MMLHTSRRRWSDGHHSSVLKRLKHCVFERLLLEKWKWFRYDDSEMLVKSRCLAFAYGQSSGEGKQLQAMITKLEKCQLTEKEAILHFMLLMGSSKDDLEGQGVLNDSGVCMCEPLFESVPRLCDVDNLHSALTSSQRVSHSARGGRGITRKHTNFFIVHPCSCLSALLVAAFEAGVLSYHLTRIKPHPLPLYSAALLTQKVVTSTRYSTFHGSCQTSLLP